MNADKHNHYDFIAIVVVVINVSLYGRIATTVCTVNFTTLPLFSTSVHNALCIAFYLLSLLAHLRFKVEKYARNSNIIKFMHDSVCVCARARSFAQVWTDVD